VFHHAAFGGNVEVVEAVLNQGVDPKAKDKRGTTPLDIAQFLGHPSLIIGIATHPECSFNQADLPTGRL